MAVRRTLPNEGNYAIVRSPNHRPITRSRKLAELLNDQGRSTPEAKALGEHFGKSLLENSGLRLLDRVFGPVERDLASGRIRNRKAGTWIAVARLTHRAGIDQMVRLVANRDDQRPRVVQRRQGELITGQRITDLHVRMAEQAQRPAGGMHRP